MTLILFISIVLDISIVVSTIVDQMIGAMFAHLMMVTCLVSQVAANNVDSSPGEMRHSLA